MANETLQCQIVSCFKGVLQSFVAQLISNRYLDSSQEITRGGGWTEITTDLGLPTDLQGGQYLYQCDGRESGS